MVALRARLGNRAAAGVNEDGNKYPRRPNMTRVRPRLRHRETLQASSTVLRSLCVAIPLPCNRDVLPSRSPPAPAIDRGQARRVPDKGELVLECVFPQSVLATRTTLTSSRLLRYPLTVEIVDQGGDHPRSSASRLRTYPWNPMHRTSRTQRQQSPSSSSATTPTHHHEHSHNHDHRHDTDSSNDRTVVRRQGLPC